MFTFTKSNKKIIFRNSARISNIITRGKSK